MIGKRIRLERIIDRNSGKTVIIPMDHGVTVGPVDGLTDMRDAISKVVAGGANAQVSHALHGDPPAQSPDGQNENAYQPRRHNPRHRRLQR